MNTTIDAKLLVEILRDYAELVPRSYSGRAMYGRRCVSVTVEPREALSLGTLIAMAATGVTTDAFGDDIGSIVEAVHELMGQAREDSMGRDVVVYWPDLEWPKGEVEDKEEDD